MPGTPALEGGGRGWVTPSLIMEPMAKQQQHSPWAIGCGIFIIFAICSGIFNAGKKKDSDEPVSSTVSESSPDVASELEPPTVKQPDGTLKSMEGTLKPGGWGELPGTEDDLQGCVISAAMFYTSAALVDDVRKHKLTDSQKRLVARYRTAAIARQRQGFPRLRKRFGELYHQKLWEEDIEVRLFGSGNRNIEFTGGVFAANRNIKAFMEGASENLQAMRFSQARFKWYRGADEWQYFNLKTPRDSDFVRFDTGSFVKVK